jgi:hypothetical protein
MALLVMIGSAATAAALATRAMRVMDWGIGTFHSL